LEYAHIEYENKKYAAGGAPDFSRECWLSEKFTLNLDFPNLPYLIDGDVRITQSNACYRYIARKAGLYGKTEKEMALADMCADQVMDFRNDVITVCYNWSESLEKKYLTETLPRHLTAFENFLSSKTWLVGDSLTFPDFHLYELLDQNMTLLPGSVDRHPKLVEYHKRFRAIPAIHDYLSSDRFVARPINNPTAHYK